MLIFFFFFFLEKIQMSSNLNGTTQQRCGCVNTMYNEKSLQILTEPVATASCCFSALKERVGCVIL